MVLDIASVQSQLMFLTGYPLQAVKYATCKIFAFFTSFRNKCDVSVHLDTCGYFFGSAVHFEFQTILDTSYEICNFLRTSDVVGLLQLVVSDLAAMLRVGFPQFTFFDIFRLAGRALKNGPNRSNINLQMTPKFKCHNQSEVPMP